MLRLVQSLFTGKLGPAVKITRWSDGPPSNAQYDLDVADGDILGWE